MKNLDDLLKVKAAQAAEVEQAQTQEQEVQEGQKEAAAQKAIEGDLKGLERTKQQIILIKESLALEQEGKASAKRGRQSAEAKIDAKATDLEAVGLSKEELLSNPEYKELEEVQGVADASEQEGMYANASVGSSALEARLKTLGIEVPEGEANEQAISQAIEARILKLDTSIFETRLKIPSEREKVVSDIISTYNLRADNLLEVAKISDSTQGEKGTYKDLYSKLEGTLNAIPVVKDNPEVQQAVVQQVIKEALLKKDTNYQEKKGKREEYDSRLKAYESAKEKLPEYIEFLNTNFFDKITEALGKLDESVASHVLSSPEVQNLTEIYDFNFRDKKIIGIKSKDNALPSAEEMDRLMSSTQTPWDTNGNLSYAIQGIKKLEGMTLQDYRSTRPDVFSGNLKAIAKELPPKETVPEQHQYSDATYEKWDAAFKKGEDRAEAQAKYFTEYAAVVREVRSVDTFKLKSEKEALDKEREALRLAASKLAGGGEFRIEDGKVINVGVETQKKEQEAEKTAIGEAIVLLQKELTELGPKPEGWLSGKKTAAWDTENTRLAGDIVKKTQQIARIDESLKTTNEDWSARLDLPTDVLQELNGTSTSELFKILSEKMDEIQPRVEELGQAVRENDSVRQRLQEMEKGRFIENTSDDFYDTGLV
ncbi:MAG: hypothetical protein JWN90_4 [Parcubacteria group bacterium]|nr:hypothetical protein [Parcubacteria group bacterium]